MPQGKERTMKIGLSTYSLAPLFNEGKIDGPGAIGYFAEIGAEHVEMVPLRNLELAGNDPLIRQVREKAAACGLDISSYTVGANFTCVGPDARETTAAEVKAEIERVKREVDTGAALGVRFMRHDAGSQPPENRTSTFFERDFPKVVDACREIADYAKRFGITTSVENHGFHFQGSERIRRLVERVDRPNFRTTLDTGNFLAVDEDPLIATMNNIGIASFIHFKDCYYRKSVPFTENWIPTTHGRHFRGAIIGHGDLDMPAIVGTIRSSGYDGYISIESHSLEDPKFGAKLSLENTKALFRE